MSIQSQDVRANAEPSAVNDLNFIPVVDYEISDFEKVDDIGSFRTMDLKVNAALDGLYYLLVNTRSPVNIYALDNGGLGIPGFVDGSFHQLLGPFRANEMQLQLKSVEWNRIEALQFFHLPVYEKRSTGFGTSEPCHLNSECMPSQKYLRDASSRLVMVMEEGIVHCSGTVLNNTSDDFRPLVLSAYHCADGFTPRLENWRFDFHYRSDTCENPDEEPPFKSLIGCEILSGHRNTDFLLMQLVDDIPQDYNVFYAGWSRDTSDYPAQSLMVHHPSGDIQKYSSSETEVFVVENSIPWANGVTTPPNTHIRTRFNVGTQEPGSSGSGLFDTSGFLLGQLHGGTTECLPFTTVGTYGRFSESWKYAADSTERLDVWLDPLSIDTMMWEGRYDDRVDTHQLSGVFTTFTGEPINDVELLIRSEGEIDTVYTDSLGAFHFQAIDDITYSISYSKNTFPKNGLSTADIVIILKHLLGLSPLEDDHMLEAADTNGSEDVSVSDIVVLRKMLLGQLDDFPEEVNSWDFYPSEYTVIHIGDDFELEVKGQKKGDMNNSADPSR